MKKNKLGIGIVVSLGISAATLGFAVPASADTPSPEHLQEVCASNPAACTFVKEGESASWIEWHRAGDAVTNCSAGATVPISYWVGDVRTWTESWTVGASVGSGEELSKLFGINIGGEYTRSKAVSTEKRTNVTADPGRKNAITLGAQKKIEYGHIDVVVDTSYYIPDSWQYVEQKETHTIWNVQHVVPTGYTEVGQNERSCGEAFSVDPEDGGASGVSSAVSDGFDAAFG